MGRLRPSSDWPDCAIGQGTELRAGRFPDIGVAENFVSRGAAANAEVRYSLARRHRATEIQQDRPAVCELYLGGLPHTRAPFFLKSPSGLDACVCGRPPKYNCIPRCGMSPLMRGTTELSIASVIAVAPCEAKQDHIKSLRDSAYRWKKRLLCLRSNARAGSSI